MKEKKDPTTLEAFFSLVLLLFLLCNPCFPFAYKRGSRAPLSGGEKTQEHDMSTQLGGKRALSTRSLIPQRLGILSLCRLFVTPTANQVSVTRATADWT